MWPRQRLIFGFCPRASAAAAPTSPGSCSARWPTPGAAPARRWRRAAGCRPRWTAAGRTPPRACRRARRPGRRCRGTSPCRWIRAKGGRPSPVSTGREMCLGSGAQAAALAGRPGAVYAPQRSTAACTRLLSASAWQALRPEWASAPNSSRERSGPPRLRHVDRIQKLAFDAATYRKFCPFWLACRSMPSGAFLMSSSASSATPASKLSK
mmetsp:Transcript_51359/g.135413  ORF Transcript_51359/g.135413 Transcript_51359/m.135413 type:complete len:210 (+) Transcript_51359:1808-2437(+)